MARSVQLGHSVHFSNTVVQGPPLGPRWKLGAFQLHAESRFGGRPAGGDFYAFELYNAKRLAMVVGDACGHGSEGARLLRSMLPRLQAVTGSITRPSQMLEALNRLVAEEMPSDRFVTGAAFDFDAKAGVLTVSNAGHVPAIVRDIRGNVKVIGQASGPPLGMLGDCRYSDQSYRIAKDDVVIFMTDGILEVVEEDLAKMSKLMALVAEAPPGSREVHRFLMDTVNGCARRRRADDQTLICLQILCAGTDVAGSIELERMV